MNFSQSTLDINTLLMWLVFGAVVGVIIHLFDSGSVRGGLVGSLVTGIVGAVVGGMIAQYMYGPGTTPGFNFPTLIVALLGALSLVIVQRILFRDNRHIRTITKTGDDYDS